MDKLNKRINFYTDEKTRIKFKTKCIKVKKTMTDILNDFVKSWIKIN